MQTSAGGRRVAVACPPGAVSVQGTLGIWMSAVIAKIPSPHRKRHDCIRIVYHATLCVVTG